MIGATLSRWTMSYFAAALIALIAAEGLIAAGFGFPSAPIEAPDTLVVVHIVAIGWLSLLMCGALFQFVPVLVARPIHDNALPLPTLVCLVGGLAMLLLGFLQLAGRVAHGLPFFPAAVALLVLGFILVAWNLGRTMWAARPLTLAARFVTVGLVAFGATVALGSVFALALDGIATAGPLVDLTTFGIPIHAAAGLGGWLTLTAIGVSYRLLAMFMLAPELDRASSRGVLWLGTAALAVLIVGGIVAICHGGSLPLALSAAGLLAAASLGLYGNDILYLYRARKRRKIELNSRMAGAALISLAVCIALTVMLIALGRLGEHIGAVVFLFSFGWLTGLGLGKLYKIVAFVTWLETYGPVLGKTPTPRVQDLVVEPRAIKWFWLYFAAVYVATAALLAGAPLVVRLAAAAMLIATCGIVAQLVRTRCLLDVTDKLRLPAGVRQPQLLYATPRQT
ncbi:MAG: hypothetical protein DCC74_01795 [Proteobacteria bacterium]|nr:MAG: hypothetical protein DCC74_01795 [Pseudomonadota bacterium]